MAKEYTWQGEQVGLFHYNSTAPIIGVTAVDETINWNTVCFDCQNAISKLSGMAGYGKTVAINPNFQQRCAANLIQNYTTPNTTWFLPQSPAWVAEWSTNPIIYDPIDEAEYKILNDGTLKVSSEGGWEEIGGDLVGDPNTNFGMIRVPKKLTIFNEEYFNELMDIEIHELIPEKATGWPKAPPVFRQVWSGKAGPGGWPSGPEVISDPPKAKDQANVVDIDKYYDGIFGDPRLPSAPPQTIIDGWGPITSNKWYPKPPGILCFNVIGYITDADKQGFMDPFGGVGGGGIGKYIVMAEDRPLFVADVYSYKTVPGSDEAHDYGDDVEVETDLEYEWIVDGKTVSTKKWYQIWGQGRPHGAKGADTTSKNDSFSTTSITVTLVVKNSIGSVSTTLSYLVWGGMQSVGTGGTNPLDIGRGSTVADKANYYHGTPIYALQSVDPLQNTVPLDEPWGSYYTWDASLGNGPGKTEGQEIVAKDGANYFYPNYPWAIACFNNNGTGGTDPLAPMTGFLYKISDPYPQIEASMNVNSGISYNSGEWYGYYSNANPMPGIQWSPPEGPWIPRYDKSVPMHKASGAPGTPKNTTFTNDLTGFKKFWKNRVWSYEGFGPHLQPPDPQLANISLIYGDPNFYEHPQIPSTEVFYKNSPHKTWPLQSWVKLTHKSILLRPPSSEELIADPNIKGFMFELAIDYKTNPMQQAETVKLILKVPKGTPIGTGRTWSSLPGQWKTGAGQPFKPNTGTIGQPKYMTITVTALYVGSDGYIGFDFGCTGLVPTFGFDPGIGGSKDYLHWGGGSTPRKFEMGMYS